MRAYAGLASAVAALALLPAVAAAGSWLGLDRPVSKIGSRVEQAAIRSGAQPVSCSTVQQVTARKFKQLARRYPTVRTLGAYKKRGRSGRPSRRWTCVRVKSASTSTSWVNAAPDAGVAFGADSPVDLPSRLDQPTTIATPQGRVSIDLVGAPAAREIVTATGSRFETSQYDVTTNVGVGTMKEFITVTRRQGNRRWQWKLTSQAGTPEIGADGQVHIGERITLHAPVVFNARHKVISRPKWHLDGTTLWMQVDDRRMTLPYVIDPSADFPQRLYLDGADGTAVTDAAMLQTGVSPFAGPPAGSTVGKQCSRVSIANAGDQLFASMANPGSFPGATITNATNPSPSGMAGGWAMTPSNLVATVAWVSGVSAPSDSVVFASVHGGRVVYSWDGGCSWALGNLGGATEDQEGVDAFDTTTAWVVGNDPAGASTQNVHKTTDGGVNWVGQSTPVNNKNLKAVDAVSASVVYAVGSAGTIYRTSNGGTSWIDQTANQSPANANRFRAVSALSATTAWAAGQNGVIYKTTDSGATWNQQASGTANEFWGIHAVDANVVYASGAGGTVIKTTNGGTTWAATSAPPGLGAFVAYDVDCYSTTDCSLVGDNGLVWRTSNGGTSWIADADPSSQDYHDIDVRSATSAYLASGTGDVLRYATSPGIGSNGWVTEAFGGTTLPAGPWTIGGRVCRDFAGAGNATVSIKGRIWKVTTDGSGAITGSTAMTGWSALSGTAAIGPSACANLTTSVAPTVTTMTPVERLYVEYALNLSLGPKSAETVSLVTADANTYIDFTAAGSTNTPPPAPGAPTIVPTPVSTWVNTATPTFSAALTDPDSLHHLNFVVCSANPTPAQSCAAAGGVVEAFGNSAASQVIGSTSNSWVSWALTEGMHYLRVAVTEDSDGTNPQSGVSAWNTSTPVGVDTVAPANPTTFYDLNTGFTGDQDWGGSLTALSASWAAGTDATSGVASYDWCFSSVNSGCTPIVGTSSTSGNTTRTASATASVGALVDGSWVYTCVRTHDVATNVAAAWSCSDGWQIESAPPTNPTAANIFDLSITYSADVDWGTSTTALSASWNAGSDAVSGVRDYDVCFSTVNSGCTAVLGTAMQSGNTTRTATATATGLPEGFFRYVCVRTWDNAGNDGGWQCSDGFKIDATAPVTTAPLDGAGADIDFQLSTTALSANWAAASDGLGIGVQDYDWRLCTSVACTTILASGTGAGTTASASSLSLTNGSTYYACIAARDLLAHVSAWSCSDGVAVDTAAPTMTTPSDGVAADVDFQVSPSTINANWSAATDGGSGVASYDWRVCTSVACTTILASGSSGMTTSMSTTGLSLVDGSTYYACVRALDALVNTSAWSCSDGVLVASSGPIMTAPPTDGAGADIDFQAAAPLLANWTAATSGAPVATYDWRFCTTVGCGAILASGTTAALTASSGAAGLTNGQIYHACVRGTDTLGTSGAWSCSDGVTLDQSAPTMSTPNDGPAADLTAQGSTTSLQSNWAVAGDGGAGSGTAGYDWRFCTTVACTTIVASGSTAGTSANATGLSLTVGAVYYACVRATDNVANTSAWSCSNGVAIDGSPPVTTPPVDGVAADIDFQLSTSTLDANWSAATDISGVAGYDWRFCPSVVCGSIVASGSTAGLTATATGLSLTSGATYYACMRATDNVGNVGAWTCSDGVNIDTVAPTATFYSVVEASAYVHWSGPVGNNRAWYNPSAVGAQSLALRVQSTDGGSGMDRVDFPNLAAATWTPLGAAGTALGPVPIPNLYEYTYTFDPGMGVVGDPVTASASARDLAGNVAPVAFDIDPDAAAPTGGSVAYTNGYHPSTTMTVNTVAGTDAQSGIASRVLERDVANLIAGSCVGWSGYGTPVASPPPSYIDSTLIDARCYRYRVIETDNVGNTVTVTGASITKLDLSPPTGSIVLAEGSNPQYQYLATPTHMYVNPAQAGSFTATVTATAASGIQDVAFPALGGGWSGDLVDPVPAYAATYAWTPVAATPGAKNAVATTNGLISANVPFIVDTDAAAPTGGGISYPNQFQTGTGASVTLTNGTDPIGVSRRQLERQSGTLAAGVCTSYTAWLPVGAVNPSTPYADTVPATEQCYRYRYAEYDNVDNVSYATGANEIKVDSVNPSTPTLTRAANVISWPTQTDFHSGVNRIEFYIDGALTATLAASATSHNYGVIPDGTYAMKVRAIDNAGNFVDSAVMTVINDSLPPAAFTLTAPVNPALPAITTAGVSPACAATPTYPSATPTFQWAASSDSGSGLDRYDVRVDGSVIGATVAPGTSHVAAASLAAGTHAWYVEAYDLFGNARTSTPASMTVAVDTASPTAATVSPVAAAASTDTTPTLTWTASDENCLARARISVDGTVVATAADTETSWTVAAPLADGTHTWSVEAIDSAGKTTASAASTFVVDTTGPTGVTAVSPSNAGSIAEGMLTYDWTPGADTGTAVAKYDITVDGIAQTSCGAAACPSASNILAGTDSWGAFPTHIGAHTWQVRAYDTLGNFSDFVFTFTATAVPDTTAPNAFSLTSPANGATLPTAGSLMWGAAWDFNGINRYEIFIDGSLYDAVAGTETSYLLGTAADTVDWAETFDPPARTWTYPTLWDRSAHGAYNRSGSSLGFTGVDKSAATSTASVDATIPATGAYLEAYIHYDTHQSYDGLAWQVSTDGGATWKSTCNKRSVLARTVNCSYDIVERINGYTGELSGHSMNPLKNRETYTGVNVGMRRVQIDLTKFAGTTVKLRLVAGWDNWTVATGSKAMSFYIDDVALKESNSVAAGSHTWSIEAVDPSGNRTASNQTWTVVTL